MVVMLRLQRLKGIKNVPNYRLVAADKRFPVDGRYIEQLGTYVPRENNGVKEVHLNFNRIKYWLSVGAQPSERVHKLLSLAGILPSVPLRVPEGWTPEAHAALFDERVRKHYKIQPYEEHLKKAEEAHANKIAARREKFDSGIYNKYEFNRRRTEFLSRSLPRIRANPVELDAIIGDIVEHDRELPQPAFETVMPLPGEMMTGGSSAQEGGEGEGQQ